ncbi:MAG: hypothetical protein SWO11_22725 [Thermodesulfobacteriota bacterium]|nr:hypothetical protein [Thermodesulfobacteriota bacterium]
MEPESILVENLRTALDRIERYMIFGIGSSLFLVILGTAAPELAKTGEGVEIPGGFISTEPRIVAAVVLAAYWVAGLMASYTVSRAERIVKTLKKSPEILEAALTYPSIATTKIYYPRIGAALLPPALLLIALAIEGGWPKSYYSVLGFLILLTPYITLAFQLRVSVGGYKSDKFGD